MAQEQFSIEAARRIALAAQGFADPRPTGRVGASQLRRVIERLGVLQVDSVNVLCRSHYLPLFSRLGAYPRELLDTMAWGTRGRELFEYFWGHKAALIPIQSFPLLRWRMHQAAGHDWSSGDIGRAQLPWAVVVGMTRLTDERPGLVDDVLAAVDERGPIAAGEIHPREQWRRGPDDEGGRMWNWKDTKIAVEWLYCAGVVTVAARRNFERLYDRTDRVIPAELLDGTAPDADEAQRELVRIAARAQGIATARELCGPGRTYVPLPTGAAKLRVGELVDAGELVPVRIDGVRQQQYLWPDALQPERVDARALLSPFDSLIWTRERTERLFDFHYRTSIYTPETERVDGYYVLPFLLGD